MYKIQQRKCKLVADGSPIRLPANCVAGPSDAVKVAEHLLRDLPHEEVLALGLNAECKILTVVRVSVGGINSAAICPGDVLRPILVSGARALILAHNHLSGCPNPSNEDIDLTANLVKACNVVGLQLLDHLIVGNHTLSLRDGNSLFGFPELFSS